VDKKEVNVGAFASFVVNDLTTFLLRYGRRVSCSRNPALLIPSSARQPDGRPFHRFQSQGSRPSEVSAWLSKNV